MTDASGPPNDAPRRRLRLLGHPRTLLIIGGCVVVALVITIAVLSYRLGGATVAASTPTPTPTPSATAPTIPQIYKGVGPSVVIIETSTGKLGTGVVATEDGTILTADHVISGGGTVSVTFADGTTSPAAVSSADVTDDIATLSPAKLPEVLVPATLGGNAAIGGSVVAIGNPLGLTFSVSSGVISGLNRGAHTANGDFSGLIQFDASVNPGSSGGPLLDANGHVVGIVVSIADPGHDDAWAGIGFAVPIGAALGGGPGGTKGPHL